MAVANEITDLESISEVFSIFHDGEIAGATVDGDDLRLEIDITYLAVRVCPEFSGFTIHLNHVEDLTFATWPKNLDVAVAPQVLTDASLIFDPPLDILSGRVVEGRLEVVCNQTSKERSYCGGIVSLRVGSARVTDPLGKAYSIDELGTICKGYWEDWSKGHAHP